MCLHGDGGIFNLILYVRKWVSRSFRTLICVSSVDCYSTWWGRLAKKIVSHFKKKIISIAGPIYYLVLTTDFYVSVMCRYECGRSNFSDMLDAISRAIMMRTSINVLCRFLWAPPFCSNSKCWHTLQLLLCSLHPSTTTVLCLYPSDCALSGKHGKTLVDVL